MWWPVFLFFLAVVAPASAQSGYWKITRLPIANAQQPSINNSGEIVWADTRVGGIFSNVRGKLADSGILPHLANSDEVVYADWFEGPAWDLVSTTRGRLTFGGIIDVNASAFDVNAKGEVVYAAADTNNFLQIFSTVRGQITFEASTHFNPCINDFGEVIWNQYINGPVELVSSTRGVISGVHAFLLDLNNLGEFCYSGSLVGPRGLITMPHIFSSTHGVIINDSQQFQWYGSVNDAGTIVWDYPVGTDGLPWYLFKAEWVPADTTPPEIFRITATPDTLWPPNKRMISVTLTVDAADNFDPAPISSIIKITSNGRQDPSDWEITGPLMVELRAIPPVGQDRVYTIVVECRDASGNASSASLEVRVSKNTTKVKQAR